MGPTHNYVAEYEGTPGQWTIIGGPATAVYAGSAGVFAVSPGSGDIYQYDGTPDEWTEIGGPGVTFTEAGDHLYGEGPHDSYVAEYDGTPNEWTVIRDQPTQQLQGGADGLFAVTVDTAENVLKYNGTPGDWTNIGFGSARDIAVGTNSVYADTLNGVDVAQWTPGSGWVQIGPPIPGQSVQSLVGGGGGVVANILASAGSWEYNGTPGSWTKISVNPSLDVQAVSTDYIYGLDVAETGPPTDVEVYSGTGTQWMVIGGSASATLAAGD